MGETITIGDSLIITIFSMAIVFLALIIISYLIDALRTVSNKDNNKQENKVESNIEKETNLEEVLDKDETMDDEELVAVIAAAIASSLGVEVPKVKIKSIKRVPQNAPAWAKVGRQEQILNRL